MLAVEALVLALAELIAALSFSKDNNRTKEIKNAIEVIYVIIPAIVLNCIAGSILMYIFIKIYSVVKKASNEENPELPDSIRDSRSSINSYVDTSPRVSTLLKS